MKCPFELPVQPKDKCHYTGRDVIEIIDSRNSGFIATVRNIENRDYIVQAINSYELHKKLVSMLDQYLMADFWHEHPGKAIDAMCEALKEKQ